MLFGDETEKSKSIWNTITIILKMQIPFHSFILKVFEHMLHKK